MVSQLACTWRPLSLECMPANIAARSSRSLTVVGGKAYVFGVELRLRTPIGKAMLVLDLQVRPARVFNDDKLAKEWPSAKVGSAMAAHRFFYALFLGVERT